jgi:serine protease
MKKVILCCFFIFSLFGSAYSQYFRIQANVPAEDIVQGKLVFKVKPIYNTLCRHNGVDIKEVNESLRIAGVTSIVKKYPNHVSPAGSLNRNGYEMVDLSTIYEAEFNPEIPVEKLLNNLLATGKLQYAEPVYKMHLLFYPNDPDTASQYYLSIIHAYDAWDVAQGDSNFVVGVTDTGTDLDHPDLAAGIAYNYADPVNGVDDDADGYVDNFMGWDLGQNDNDPSIDIVHGSFVCGLAGAVTNNGTGIAAAGFKSRFLPIKISNNGVLTVAYDGIVYAADHNCTVINCSWGSFGGGQFGQDIIDYATINKNCLVVAASGNSNSEAPFFPASYNNVLSVTGTNNTDTKWVNSSYGAFVDVSAPGEGIYSTIFDNGYSFSSGTSFASPIVAGAAALVRTQFAFYTPGQIAEQLRATSDDIYSIAGNIPYLYKLGKGRINMYRALTETPKSVRMLSFNATDNNDNAFSGGDTLDITVFLRNYLEPLANLNVSLSCSDPNISILSGTINPGAMATLADYDNTGNPFRVIISNSVPFNTKATFILTFNDGAYTDWQIFDIVVNVDYINVLVNDVGTSITSKGRIGYNEPAQVQGIGFTYNDGPSLLYESGLLVGTDTAKVSDHIFDAPVSVTNNDFISLVNVHRIIPTVHSDFDLESRFNDDGAGSDLLQVNIGQKTFAWSDPVNSKYIIVEYTLLNTGTNSLDNLFAGIYADWDIGNVIDNRAEYDAGLKMGYCFNTGTPTYYTAVKQLDAAGNNYYGIDNDGSAGSVGIYDGFTKAEKYLTMSTPRTAAGQAGSGNDVSMMIASGPHSIPAGDSSKVAFALIAGEDLASIQASAAAAQIKYATLNSVVQLPAIIPGLQQALPNPFQDAVAINYGVSRNQNVLIEIFDVLGSKVQTLVNKQLPAGNYTVTLKGNKLADGIYYCRMISGNLNQVLRIVKYK